MPVRSGAQPSWSTTSSTSSGTTPTRLLDERAVRVRRRRVGLLAVLRPRPRLPAGPPRRQPGHGRVAELLGALPRPVTAEVDADAVTIVDEQVPLKQLGQRDWLDDAAEPFRPHSATTWSAQRISAPCVVPMTTTDPCSHTARMVCMRVRNRRSSCSC